jgi:putative ABC transport system permease protein
MVLSEILKLAMDSFRASKLRFALTALGMVIGTASVILVVTIGMTGKQYILELNSEDRDQLGRAGICRRRRHGQPSARLQRLAHPRRREGRVAQLPGVMYSSPVMDMHARISFGGGVVKDTLVLGVSPQYQNIRNLLVPVGRFFDDEDDTAHLKCAVVSELFARDRFGSSDAAVGQTFEISGIPFTIIGVFKRAWTTSASRRSRTRPF